VEADESVAAAKPGGALAVWVAVAGALVPGAGPVPAKRRPSFVNGEEG
jgi:hypothetical protein